MYFLISVLTQFLLVALVATAAVLGVAVGYFYVRARRVDTTPVVSERDRLELQRRDSEIAAIRARIEEMYQRQHLGSETQHALVGQQIEQLQHQLKARSRQIEGLQGQLRYEMEQRETAMQELRDQLSEVLRTFSNPALAPPVAQRLALSEPAAAPVGAHEAAPMPAPESTPAAAPSAPPPSPSGWTWEPVELDFDMEASEPSVASQELVSPLASQEEHDIAPEPGKEEDDAEGYLTFFDISHESASDEAQPASPSAFEDLIQWAPIGEDENAEAPAYTFDDLLENPFAGSDAAAVSLNGGGIDGGGILGDGFIEDPFGGAYDEPAYIGENGLGGDGFASQTEEPARPEGAEDLTVLPVITEERQARLYQMGIHTIEDIARWNRADARRVAAAMDRAVSEDVIMNEWVFAAQSVLFDRYQSDLHARRTGAY